MSIEKSTENITLPVMMISLALALRQMSMTIVAPFISTYCKSLIGYTPLLAGIAVGAFGLMQALFQIPFGMLSDRYGNKRVLLSGLLLVIAGLITGFYAKSIFMLIFARVLQGSGAIIGVGYSWTAGLTDDPGLRTKSMSILGAFVSAAAALAFAVGPLLRNIMLVSQMFLAGAVLLTLNSLYILIFLKDTAKSSRPSVPKSSDILPLLRNRSFLLMNAAAFLNNFMMMSVFYAAPIYMDKITGQEGMWKIFVPAIFLAILYMKLCISCTSLRHNTILLLAFALSSISILCYFHPNSFLFLFLGTSLFLCGYVTIATVAATHVNETLESSFRGTGNGIFNSFQYIGNFGGALVTGALWEKSQHTAWIIVIAAGVTGFAAIALYQLKSAPVIGEKRT